MKMSKSVKRVMMGVAAVVAARRVASWGLASAALALSAIQKALDDAATPPLRAAEELPPRLRRDREAADDLKVALDLREEAPV